jgi:hypothetical protein
VVAVREATFDANEALINLEADQRRAQLELERALAASAPVEADVFSRLEAVSRTELSVRKNRVQLVLKIRKLVGPDLWTRLEAELPGRPGPLRPPPPPGEQGPR